MLDQCLFVFIESSIPGLEHIIESSDKESINLIKVRFHGAHWKGRDFVSIGLKNLVAMAT